MVLTAVRGGLGFLSRLPVGHDESAWAAFRDAPVALPLVGAVVGAIVAVPLLLPLAAPTVALAFVVGVYGLTGITHLDGLADLGDALVVHGDADRRLAVMGDTTVGVGGIAAVGLVLLGLWSAGLTIAGGPTELVLLVVAAEVGAKLGMALVAGLGTPTHEGLGSALAGHWGPRSLVVPGLVALPAAGLSWPTAGAAVALATGPVAGLVVLWWARRRLGGISGDVLGATNEVGRVAALHAGVIAWTRW